MNVVEFCFDTMNKATFASEMISVLYVIKLYNFVFNATARIEYKILKA
jgi:hypothetical protein